MRRNPVADDISTVDIAILGGVGLVAVGIVAYAYVVSKTASAAIQNAPLSGNTMPPSGGSSAGNVCSGGSCAPADTSF
jgi:hypothetical protein